MILIINIFSSYNHVDLKKKKKLQERDSGILMSTLRLGKGIFGNWSWRGGESDDILRSMGNVEKVGGLKFGNTMKA